MKMRNLSIVILSYICKFERFLEKGPKYKTR